MSKQHIMKFADRDRIKRLCLVLTPDRKAVTGKIIGKYERTAGEINELVPVVERATFSGFIDRVSHKMFGKPINMNGLSDSNLKKFDLIDVDTKLPTGIEVWVYFQDIDNPNRRLKDESSADALEKEEIKKELENALYENELMNSELIELRRKDKMRKKEENEEFSERRSANWSQPVQQ